MDKKRHKPKDETKREAILKSATRLFLKQGFSHTSMEQVAASARVTKQTVYSHFQSKDILFTQMIVELSKKHTPSEAFLATPTSQSLPKILHEIGMALLSMLTSKDGLAATRLVIAELHHHPELAQRYYEDATQRMVNMLAQFLKSQKGLSIKDPASAAACFFSMLKGRYYVQMLLGIRPTPDPKEKEKHVKETIHNFLRLYAK